MDVTGSFAIVAVIATCGIYPAIVRASATEALISLLLLPLTLPDHSLVVALESHFSLSDEGAVGKINSFHLIDIVATILPEMLESLRCCPESLVPSHEYPISSLIMPQKIVTM
jgi:hypothetical protein